MIQFPCLNHFESRDNITVFLILISPFSFCGNLEIISDPSYPGQWRVQGEYVEQVAKMTHWEYPEAVSRFGRQLEALGIARELEQRGAVEGDLVMIDKYDFEFSPGMTNPYIPQELLERDSMFEGGGDMLADGEESDDEDDAIPWRPFSKGGFLDVDVDELAGFNESGDWDILDDDDFDDSEFAFSDDEVWTSSD